MDRSGFSMSTWDYINRIIWSDWTIPTFDSGAWTFGGQPEPEPEPCNVPEGITIELGPQNWHHEMRPKPASYPVGILTRVRLRWAEFTANDFPVPTNPGYDFSNHTTDDEQHGPEQRRIDGRRKKRRR